MIRDYEPGRDRDRLRACVVELQAMDARHWTSPDLAECGRQAEASLRQRFPDLSAEAISAIVNAAAYQWR
jgi:hypothetical protein